MLKKKIYNLNDKKILGGEFEKEFINNINLKNADVDYNFANTVREVVEKTVEEKVGNLNDTQLKELIKCSSVNMALNKNVKIEELKNYALSKYLYSIVEKNKQRILYNLAYEYMEQEYEKFLLKDDEDEYITEIIEDEVFQQTRLSTLFSAVEHRRCNEWMLAKELLDEDLVSNQFTIFHKKDTQYDDIFKYEKGVTHCSKEIGWNALTVIGGDESYANYDYQDIFEEMRLF